MVLTNTLDTLSQASTIVEFIFSTDLLNVQRSILGQINKCMNLAYEENVFLPHETSCESQVWIKSGIITVGLLGSFQGVRIKGTNS